MCIELLFRPDAARAECDCAVLQSFRDVEIDIPVFDSPDTPPPSVEGQVYMDRYRHAAGCIASLPGYNLTTEQKRVTEKFLSGCLPHLVGQDAFRANPAYFRSQCSETAKSELIACLMPRRFGKTVSTASFIAALLVSSPRINIAVFSPTQRQSSMLTGAIKTILRQIQGRIRRGMKITKDNEEVVEVRFDDQPEACEMRSLPASETGTRGTTAGVVVCEEFMQIPVDFFRKVVVPLLGVADTQILCISTPLGLDTYYVEMVQARKVDGGPLFDLLEVTLMCDACLKKKSPMCIHYLDRQPRWKPSAKLGLLREVLQIGVDDGDNTFLNENMGVRTGLSNCVFLRSSLDRWLLCPPARRERPHNDTVYVLVDPTGGGYSELAIMCVYLVPNRNRQSLLPFTIRICCIHSQQVGHAKSDENDAIIYGILLQMRERFGPKTILVSVIERNLAPVLANYIATNFARVVPAMHMCANTTGSEPDVGFTTTQMLKEAFVQSIGRYINAQAVIFDDDCLSPGHETYLPMKSRLFQQLCWFRRVVDRRGANWAEPVTRLTGKGPGKKDDLVLCLCFAHWALMDQRSPGLPKVSAEHVTRRGV